MTRTPLFRIFTRCLLAALLSLSCAASFARGPQVGTIARSNLPPEAIHVLDLIARGGPFPFARDGIVFGNYERRLPTKPRGYYHEYTVPTPGTGNRGARRIITGSAQERFYTPDHYQTFLRILQ